LVISTTCEKYDLRAPGGRGLEPVPDHRFGLTALVAGRPARVHIRGVDGVQTAIDEAIEQTKSRRLVYRPAEDVGAEYERRDLET
jgi:hypothetical protein